MFSFLIFHFYSFCSAFVHSIKISRSIENAIVHRNRSCQIKFNFIHIFIYFTVGSGSWLHLHRSITFSISHFSCISELFNHIFCQIDNTKLAKTNLIPKMQCYKWNILQESKKDRVNVISEPRLQMTIQFRLKACGCYIIFELYIMCATDWNEKLLKVRIKKKSKKCMQQSPSKFVSCM